jgi:hypothetical protein
MNAADQPFHAATIDESAAQLGHPRLRNSELRRDNVLRLRAESANDLARELVTEGVDRISRCRVHISSKRAAAANHHRFAADRYSEIIACSRSGSSPSQSGFVAVESNSDVVLNSSNSPRVANGALLANSVSTCASLNGANVCATSIA